MSVHPCECYPSGADSRSLNLLGIARLFVVRIWPYIWPVVCELVPAVTGYLSTQEGRSVVFGCHAHGLSEYAACFWWGGLLVLIALIVLRSLMTNRKSKKLGELERANENYRKMQMDVERLVPSALKGILESLMDELNLTPCARISLYIVQNTTSGLSCFCQERCANNLKYERKCCQLRPLSKMSEKIWNEESFHVANLPDPKKRQREYDVKCKDLFGISLSELKKLSFRFRSYAGCRIDYKGLHLGFLLVSSEATAISVRLSEAEILGILRLSAQKLGAVIAAFKEYMPSPTITESQEGF